MTSTITTRWRSYAAALIEDANDLPNEASLLINAARVRSFLLILLAGLAFASPAQAMDLGYQQEGMSPARCDQIAAMHGKWARLMVQSERWAYDHDRYLDTVKHCKARGLRVIATLTHWNGKPATTPGMTAAQWAFFSAVAAKQLGPYVDAWSPMNEPNHASFGPSYNPHCAAAKVVSHRHKVWRYKRVRHGSYKRVVRHHKVHYRRVKHGRGHYKRVRRYRTVRSVYGAPDPQVCMARAARRVYDASAAQIKRFDPSALLIMGDTAGPGSIFMRAWLDASPKPPLANVYGLHYSVPNQGVREIAAKYKLSIWLTEWGIGPDAQGAFKPWLKALRDSGLGLTIYYGGFEADQSWRDTHLTPTSLKAASAWR